MGRQTFPCCFILKLQIQYDFVKTDKKDKSMRKLILSLLFFTVLLFPVFISCEDSGGGDDDLYEESHKAISLGNTLTISGTVTKYFSSGGPTWGDGSDAAAASYDLISTQGGDNNGELVDSDDDENDSDDSFSFSSGVPVNRVVVADWGFTSSVSGVEVYSAEVQDSNDEHIAEFLFISGEYVLWYEYIYASADTVISGKDESETYIFDDVSLFQGWNKVISRTADGLTFTYTGGTLSGTAWTFMKD